MLPFSESSLSEESLLSEDEDPIFIFVTFVVSRDFSTATKHINNIQKCTDWQLVSIYSSKNTELYLYHIHNGLLLGLRHTDECKLQLFSLLESKATFPPGSTAQSILGNSNFSKFPSMFPPLTVPLASGWGRLTSYINSMTSSKCHTVYPYTKVEKEAMGRIQHFLASCWRMAAYHTKMMDPVWEKSACHEEKASLNIAAKWQFCWSISEATFMAWDSFGWYPTRRGTKLEWRNHGFD